MLAGGLVSRLTIGPLPERVAKQEVAAAARYRQISDSIRPLAWRAVAALTLSLALAVAAFFWNSRQLPLPLVGRRSGRHRGRSALARLVTQTLVRRPAAQAGFFFTLQCLFRSAPHRVAMAGCTAAAIALSSVMLAASSRSAAIDLARLPASVLSAQTMALAVLLAGFRHVLRLPADVRANRLFRLAWIADSSHYIAGVRRGAFVAVILPAVGLLLLPHHLSAGSAARVDARDDRMHSERGAHIPDDHQDEPAAVRRQLCART